MSGSSLTSVERGEAALDDGLLYYTRCPVPTPSGLAVALGALGPALGEAHDVDLRALQDVADPAVRRHHFDHGIVGLVRDGGNIPAIWARANGVPTRLLGLTWLNEAQAIVTTPDAGIDSVGDLVGSRVAIPRASGGIVDIRSGADAPDGTMGEILLRGYCVMNEYYKDPEKTAQALDADGWLHTGDLYTRTPDGRVAFHGRLKDMLKVGGENVAVIEIESFLCSHPAVRMASVIGQPDLRLDEVPVAFVELEPGASVSGAELREFCQGKISSYKIPAEIHFLQADEWPMSVTKIDKRGLRERLKQSHPG